jgi:hypothetical protein
MTLADRSALAKIYTDAVAAQQQRADSADAARWADDGGN